MIHWSAFERKLRMPFLEKLQNILGRSAIPFHCSKRRGGAIVSVSAAWCVPFK